MSCGLTGDAGTQPFAALAAPQFVSQARTSVGTYHVTEPMSLAGDTTIGHRLASHRCLTATLLPPAPPCKDHHGLGRALHPVRLQAAAACRPRRCAYNSSSSRPSGPRPSRVRSPAPGSPADSMVNQSDNEARERERSRQTPASYRGLVTSQRQPAAHMPNRDLQEDASAPTPRKPSRNSQHSPKSAPEPEPCPRRQLACACLAIRAWRMTWEPPARCCAAAMVTATGSVPGTDPARATCSRNCAGCGVMSPGW